RWPYRDLGICMIITCFCGVSYRVEMAVGIFLRAFHVWQSSCVEIWQVSQEQSESLMATEFAQPWREIECVQSLSVAQPKQR
ncbi:MAG: hypothetical protein WAT51_11880, partial [Holophaga sp.]